MREQFMAWGVIVSIAIRRKKRALKVWLNESVDNKTNELV